MKGSIYKPISMVIFLIITALIVWSLWGLVGGIGEERLASAAATNIRDAMDNVYVNFYAGNTNYEEFVNVTLKQDKRLNSAQDDPKWIVYSGYSADQIKVVKDESDTIATNNPGVCDEVCYGFLERKGNTELDYKEATPSEVNNFWLISPCYAQLRVFWDDTKGQPSFEFAGPIENRAAHNFCCDDNKGGAIIDKEIFDSQWPEDSNAFEEDGGNCDFQK